MRKTRIIKQNVLSGKEHKSHNNKKLIPSRRQCLAFSCKCKCYAKFSDQKLRYVFKQYYDLKSHSHFLEFMVCFISELLFNKLKNLFSLLNTHIVENEI